MDKQQFTNYLNNWKIFIKERFSLAKHIPLIIFYTSANALVALSSCSIDIFSAQTIIRLILSIIVILFVFFHMRIFDEIKDYEVDKIVNPDRPLARGIICLKGAGKMAARFIIAELLIGFFLGTKTFLAVLCVVGYTLIMYKEFFIGDWLRPKLARYALAHTLVSCWMALFIYSAVTNNYFWLASKEMWLFVLANWMIFNIFEFGRKTFGKEEERELVESYSKNFGAFGSAFCVLVMGGVAFWIAVIIGQSFLLGNLFFIMICALMLITLLASIIYSIKNTKIWAKRFRGICSIFILFYNVIIAIGILIK